MRRVREQGKFIDAVLLVGRRKILAHRAVLVGMSPYFDGLLTSGLAESTQCGQEVKLADAEIDGCAVEVIVDCMYSGELALSGDTVCSVISTASLFGVEAVEQAACEFFIESLAPCWACAALQFAARYAEAGGPARHLHKRCVDYMIKHFAECIADQEFLRTPPADFVKVIESKDLAADPATVLNAVQKWFDHFECSCDDDAGRQQCKKDLMPAVRSLRMKICACDASCTVPAHQSRSAKRPPRGPRSGAAPLRLQVRQYRSHRTTTVSSRQPVGRGS